MSSFCNKTSLALLTSGATMPSSFSDDGMASLDPVTEWLNIAGKLPILPRSEIIRIANEIQKSEIGSKKRLKLVNKLVSHNLRLVVTFVNMYMRTKTRNDFGCLDTLDYLQSGALGLHRAAEKYDPTKGYEFSTYAVYWIRSFVGRYNMRNSSPFVVSEEACRKAYQFEKRGECPNSTTNSRWNLNPRAATQQVRAAQNPLSLYQETEAGNPLMDILVAEQNENIGQSKMLVDGFVKRAKLNDREHKIIIALYWHNLDRKEICSDLALTISQFKKTKDSAMRKLRATINPDIMYV